MSNLDFLQRNYFKLTRFKEYCRRVLDIVRFEPSRKNIKLFKTSNFFIISYSVLDPEWFFRILIPLFSWYTDPDPVSDPSWTFSNILDINFTFVFLSCKFVKLHIMTRNRYSKLFREICLLREIVKFYHFFRIVIFQIHFESGTARIQIRTDFFRIC